MYGIIRNDDGTYYTSYIYGFYCRVNAESDRHEQYIIQKIYNRYYIVLNEQKNELVKKYVFDREHKYLDPLVVLTDSHDEDWAYEDEKKYNGCLAILSAVDLEAENIVLPPALLDECIALDSAYKFEEYKEINGEADIQNLNYCTGNFHDLRFEAVEQDEQGFHVILTEAWGMKLEMWFSGDAEYRPASEDAYKHVYPLGCTLLRENGYLYLIEDEFATLDGVDEYIGYIKGKSVRYHIIPAGKPEKK